MKRKYALTAPVTNHQRRFLPWKKWRVCFWRKTTSLSLRVFHKSWMIIQKTIVTKLNLGRFVRHGIPALLVHCPDLRENTFGNNDSESTFIKWNSNPLRLHALRTYCSLLLKTIEATENPSITTRVSCDNTSGSCEWNMCKNEAAAAGFMKLNLEKCYGRSFEPIKEEHFLVDA